jgi:NRPS condensation-like uncharacterized protein
MAKQFKTMASLIAEAIPTTIEPEAIPVVKPVIKASNSVQQQLVVHLPKDTVQALKRAAMEQETTVRVILLEALNKAGYPVDIGQLVDFRKVK